MTHEVQVITSGTDSRDVPIPKVIDWNDSSDRKWLQSHLHWAMNNKRFVALNPVA